MQVDIGISPCPNDTYIFSGLFEGYIDLGSYRFNASFSDVETLNNKALNNELDIVKASWGVVQHVLSSYAVLKAGGAFAMDCGPVLVGGADVHSVRDLKRVATPGFNTTANRLFDIFYSDLNVQLVEIPFDKIFTAITEREVDGGIIIHEGRFLYKELGLKYLSDLGELFIKRYNGPVPLGCILIKRELLHLSDDINSLIRCSIDFANENLSTILPHIRKHAQDMPEHILKQHIDLYVNRYSYDNSEALPTLLSFLGLTDVENIFA